jgi:hypothetical protein
VPRRRLRIGEPPRVQRCDKRVGARDKLSVVNIIVAKMMPTVVPAAPAAPGASAVAKAASE